MPTWRKLHTKAVESLDIHEMPDDFTRLLWLMLPLALDQHGRGMDNPAWVKSKLMPIRDDVSTDRIDGALAWFADHGMIERYQVESRRYFWVPTWYKFQGNCSREATSSYPAPPNWKPPEWAANEPNGNGASEHSGASHEQVKSGSCSDSDSDADADVDAENTSAAGAAESSTPEPIPDQRPECTHPRCPSICSVPQCRFDFPHRVQRSRQKSAKLPPNTTCVTRGTRWGNPYRVGDPGVKSAVDACTAYQDDLRRLPFEEFQALIVPLRGKNLACWCDTGPDTACHSDLLLELARRDDAELRSWWQAECPDCRRPRATDGTNHVRDCCTCAGEAVLDEIFGERERPPPGELRPGHWSQHTGGDTATPAQAGGAASIAEAIADRIVVQHNRVPDGLAALGAKQRRAWVKMIRGVLDQYDPITEAQARLVGDAWCVYNSFRQGPANPYYTSMPGDIGPLVARVLAGTLTMEQLRAEAANGAKKRNMAPGRLQPKPRTPEEEARIRAALEEHAK